MPATDISLAGDRWKVTALRFGRTDRMVKDNFSDAADDETAPMPMDFFVWVAENDDQVVVIDTGAPVSRLDALGIESTLPVEDGLRALGIDPRQVGDVVLTHLHCDHAGNIDLFPSATFWVQPDELAYATGPAMLDERVASVYDVDDVVAAVRALRSGRVAFAGQSTEVAPGIRARRVGGHTGGTQIVEVDTQRGVVVLLSDAAHYARNLTSRRLFPIQSDVDELLRFYHDLTSARDTYASLIPGHDPLVLGLFPEASRELAGHACRIDLRPRAEPTG